MLRNFFVILYRNMIHHKVYSGIHLIGLALGMAAFLFIYGYVRFENSYDRQHRDGERIYRIESLFFRGEQKTDHWPTSTNGYAPAMKAAFPEIEDYTRINFSNSTRVVKHGDTKFREERVCFADSNFFRFFSYPVVKGDPKTFLMGPNSVVISEKAATKFFGKEEALGQFLDISTIDNQYRCLVTGVFADLPENSTLQFDYLMSWQTSPRWMHNFWYMHESYTFVRLRPHTQVADLEARFPALAEGYKTADAMKQHTWAVDLVPLHDVHLNPAKPNEIEVKGNRQAVQFLMIIAAIILLMGWINYINLATARAMDRAREVGIRKVMGASRIMLIFQFLLESLLFNGLALLLAAGLIWAAGQLLPDYLGLRIPAYVWSEPAQYRLFVPVFVLGTLLAGLYPALVLARIEPVPALKGKVSLSGKGALLRKSLVIVQFTASLVLIAGTWVAYSQIRFMRSQDLGVSIDQVLVLKAPVQTEKYREKIESFRNTLRAIPSVVQVTGSGSVPGKEVAKFLANRRQHAELEDTRLYEMLMTDYDFIPTFGLELVAGRNFDRGRPADQYGLILNESAVKQFGFPSNEAAIGEKVLLEVNRGRANEVIGVIRDYHQQSLQQNFTPIILFMDPDYRWIPVDYYSLKIGRTDPAALLRDVEKAWTRFFPESSFDYFFLDEFFNRQYQQDRQFGRTFLLFSSLAIFIACLGLFGLTAYSTSRRSREIGIRKVLGATVLRILSMLAWDTLRLVFLSSLLAIPLAGYLSVRWLERYPFRIELSWWHGLIPLVALVLIALFTISYLSLQAALTSPAKTLRNE